MTHAEVDGRLPEPVQHALGKLATIIYAKEGLPSTLQAISELALSTVAGAEAVSITLIEAEQPSTAVYTSSLALLLDERQYAHDYGPCLDAARGGEVMHIADMAQEQRWPQYAQEALAVGARSSVSVPLPVQQALIGALNVYATRANAFDGEAIEAANSFGSYAAVALANARQFDSAARLAEEMRQALASRAAIDQAKGILMALHGGTAEEAFGRIVRESQRRNIKVREIAEDIVRRTSQGLALSGEPGEPD